MCRKWFSTMSIQICSGKHVGKWQNYMVKYFQTVLQFQILRKKIIPGSDWSIHNLWLMFLTVAQGSFVTHTATVTHIITIKLALILEIQLWKNFEINSRTCRNLLVLGDECSKAVTRKWVASGLHICFTRWHVILRSMSKQTQKWQLFHRQRLKCFIEHYTLYYTNYGGPVKAVVV